MIRCLWILLIAGSVHAQEAGFVRTSDLAFAAGEVKLPRPAKLISGQRGGSLPHLSGTWEYCYSYIDEQGRISPQSPVARVDSPGEHCNYSVSFPGVPKDQRSVGAVLWYRRPAGLPTTFNNAIEYDWLVLGAQCWNDPRDGVRPVFPMSGWMFHRMRAHAVGRCVWYQGAQLWRPWKDETFWPRSTQQGPQQAPIVTPYFFPDVDCEVAFSWVGHYGETELCEPLKVPARTGNKTINGPVEVVRLEIPPQGSLGMYLYVRTAGRAWERQPTLHSVKDYLWPVTANKIYLSRYVESGIQPVVVAPFANFANAISSFTVNALVDNSISQALMSFTPVFFPDGRSYLCSLQKCLSGSTKSVVVDSPQETYSPIINPLNNPYGTAINRVITGPHGTRFTIKTDNKPNCPTDWPVWIENTQGTILRNCTIDSATADGGIDFCDHGGSGGFYTRFENLIVTMRKSGYTFGIRQSWEGTSINSHGWSDSDSDGIKVVAAHPIVIEGNQSLNITLRRLILDGQAAGISVNNAASLRVDGLTCEGTRSIFDVLWANQIRATDVFTDQGVPSHVTVSGQTQSPTLRIHYRKINHKTDWVHLMEHASGTKGTIKLIVEGDESQIDKPVESLIYTPRYTGVRYDVAPMAVFASLKLKQPSLYWWQTNNELSSGKSYFEAWDGGKDIANDKQVQLKSGV